MGESEVQPSPTDKVKVTMNLLRRECQTIQGWADQRGISWTHALRTAIETERYLREQQAAGKKILIESPDGGMEQVVMRTTSS
jgi:hypothetical protein